MLARTIISRIRLTQCSAPISQQLSCISPSTCRTTPLVRQVSCSVCTQQEEGKRKDYKTTDAAWREGSKGYIKREVDVEESIAYMESQAFKDVYKDQPVWKEYRKNAKGNYYPQVRKTCVRKGVISTGSPCPVCRDDYLVIDYRNIKLLKQLTSDMTGEPLKIENIGLCRRQYRQLQLEVAKAHDCGYLHKAFTPRRYNYKYYHKLLHENKRLHDSSPVTSSETSSTIETAPDGVAQERGAPDPSGTQQSNV